MAGKGSRQRPTDKKRFDSNYDAIFGKKGKEGKCSSPPKTTEDSTPSS